MDCARCGTNNRTSDRFCIACGTPLDVCPTCGATLVEGARFCGSCGEPAVTQSPDDRTATRKTVTILFTDLTGSTSFGERTDPETVRSLMSPMYAAMRAEVESRGGVVAKFVGDGLMAVFGIPDIREDDATRAIDAALAMRDAIEEMSRGAGVGLLLKVGVNTGEVVVGEGDEDLVGDAVNLASRLEGACAPNEVLVGPETWRLTRANATYERVAPLSLKGKSEPVPAYRLVALERTAEAGTAPFVGRTPELARLLGAFDEAVAANAARLVTIVGSPGLGKTRLARELGTVLGRRALVAETRCDAAGGATYAPIAEALRFAAGIEGATDEGDVVDRIASLVADEPDRDRIATRAAAILGAGEPGSTEETFWAIRRLVETAAKATPMVVLLDDLHWAEPLLLDLVEHLAEWTRAAPVLLVVTGRPELREIRPSFVEDGRVVISLEGLDDNATEALACGLLGTDDVPSELLAKLPSSTEGNPLFVREFVRMLVDDGVIRRSQGSWIATVNIEAIEVPPTINSLLAARVDRLTPHERTVLELASVVGKEFYRGAIADLAPAAVRVGLDGHLESLRRKELVEPLGTYWIDEPVYRFHHALIRDAAYRRLLKESRASLHERIAGWFEEKTEGVIVERDELIGYHLEQAHESLRQLGPLGEHGRALGTRAAQALGVAARSALERDDLPAAAALTGRALERLDEGDPSRAEILIDRCEALLAMGDVASSEPALEELVIAGASSPRLRAWATCFSGELANLTDTSILRDAEGRLSAAAAELAELGDPAGAAKAHTVHAHVLARIGRVGDCEAALDRALTAAREANDHRRVTAVLGFAPVAALWGPSPVSRAGGRCLDVVRLLRITTGSPAVEATSTRCQAVLEALRGRTNAARRMLGVARTAVGELGLRHGLLETELFSGIVELVAGEPSAARTHLRDAHEGFRALGVDVDAARAAAFLGRAELMLGNIEEAERSALESERLGGDDLKSAIAWRGVRAEILGRRGRHAEAKRLAQDAVEIAARTDALFDHGAACASLSEVLRLSGDGDGARRARDQANALYERKGATVLVEESRTSARTEDLVPEGPSDADRLAAMISNRCVRAVSEITPLALAGNWDVAARYFTSDAQINDKRALMASTFEGLEEVVVFGQALTSVDTAEIDIRPIASRGERLALVRLKISGPSVGSEAFGADVVAVGEIDADGLIANVSYWDEADIDEAFAELDERYIVGEGAELADWLPPAAQLLGAINERDWERVRELMTEDFILIDHQQSSLGTWDRELYIEAMKRVAEPFAEIGTYIASILALGENAAAVIIVNESATEDGSRAEVAYCAVGTIEDGKLTRLEAFALSETEAALARFGQLSGPAEFAEPIVAPAPFDTHRPESSSQDPVATTCTRAVDRMLRAGDSRDWDALGSILAPDIVVHDHRRGAFGSAQGREQSVLQARMVAELASRITSEVVATYGDRVAVVRLRVETSEGTDFELECLATCEIDATGLLARETLFDLDELDRAHGEAVLWFVEGEGAPYASALAAIARLQLALRAQDWAAVERLVHDDFVQIDHRPASLGEMHGRDAYIESVRAMAALAPGIQSRIRSIPRLHERGGLAVIDVSGSTVEGVHIEWDYCLLAFVREGRIDRLERYPVEDLDRARARFDELIAAERPIGPPPTVCTRAFDRLFDAFTDQDWRAIGEACAEDVFLADRRAIARLEGVGRPAAISVFRGAADVGATDMQTRLLATAGERIGLWHVLGRFPDRGFEADALNAVAINDEGLITHFTTFDGDDLDAAHDEIRAWFLAGEGAPFADTLVIAQSINQAIYDQDWDGLRELLTEDFVDIDHRPASLDTHDREAYIASVRTFRELAPALITAPRWIPVLRADGAVAVISTTGQTPDGAYVEFDYCLVVEVRDGKVSRLERYPVEDLDRARARFDELVAADRPIGPPPTACTRAFDCLFDAFTDQDWAAFGDAWTEDVFLADRRAALSSEGVGRPAAITVFRGVADIGATDLQATLLATAGERVGLWHVLARFPDRDFEVDVLYAIAINDEGLITRFTAFDADDIDRAQTEVIGWAFGGELAPYADVAAMFLGYTAAMDAQDWDAWQRFVTEDHVYIDHRPASLGQIHGREAFLESVKAMTGSAPNARTYLRWLPVVDQHGAVVVIADRGSTADGVAIEVEYCVIAIVRDGRVSRHERFPVEDVDTAVARFKELTAAAPATVELENTCTRLVHEMYDRALRKDWAAATAFIAEDVVIEDRRPGLAWRWTGREDAIANMRLMNLNEGLRAIAVRGDAFALFEQRFALANDFESTVLFVFESDGSELRSTSCFNAEDQDAAFAELDVRYVAKAGRRYEELVLTGLAFSAAVDGNDYDTLRSVVSPDVTFRDHAPVVSVGEVLGIDRWIDMHEQSVRLVPAFHDERVVARGIDRDLMLVQTVVCGTSADGGPIEYPVHIVMRWLNGTLVELDSYSDEQADLATARYNELSARCRKAPALENLATRAAARYLDALIAADIDGVADMLAPGYRYVDRRLGITSEHDRQTNIEQAKISFEFPGIVAEATPFATRGDRLALFRMRFSVNDFDVESLCVQVVDDQGQLLEGIMYDLDDIDAAYRDLDDRLHRGRRRDVRSRVEPDADDRRRAALG